MKKVSRIFLMALLVMAVCLAGCGKEKEKKEENAELKEKLEKANEKAEEEFSDEFAYEEVEHGIAITEYKGAGGDLEIPEEINGQPVVVIRASTFKDASILDSLTIPICVQNIAWNTLPEGSSVKIRGYRHSMGIDYAMGRGLEYEILGENDAQASYVLVYDKTGGKSVTIEPGKEASEDFAKGISMRQENGESILTLNGCNVGSIEVEEYAALTIELAEGSENMLSAERGKDAISTYGNLTIRGNGTLYANGSDYYKKNDGNGWVGDGIYVYGNLAIKEHANVQAKCGTAKTMGGLGVRVHSGNITVDGSKLYAYAPVAGVGGTGLIAWDDGTKTCGQIILNGCQVTEGGQIAYFDIEGSFGTTVAPGTVSVSEEGYLENVAEVVRIE